MAITNTYPLTHPEGTVTDDGLWIVANLNGIGGHYLRWVANGGEAATGGAASATVTGASLTGQGTVASPLEVGVSGDAGNALKMGTDGRMYAPASTAPATLTTTQAKTATDTTAGLVTGALLDAAIDQSVDAHLADLAYHPAKPVAADVGKVLTVKAAGELEYKALPASTAPATLTATQAKSATDTTAGLVTGALLDAAIDQSLDAHLADLAYHPAKPVAADVGKVLTVKAAGELEYKALPTTTAPATLTAAQAKSATDTTAGLITGALLDAAIDQSLDAHIADDSIHLTSPVTADVGKYLRVKAAGEWEVVDVPTTAKLTVTQAQSATDTVQGTLSGEVLNDAIGHHIENGHEANEQYHAAPPTAAQLGYVLTAEAADKVSYQPLFDPTKLAAVGSENTLELNTNTKTLDDVLKKLNDYVALVPESLNSVVLVDAANLTASKAKFATAAVDDLLFEWATNPVSYTAIALKKFVDGGAFTTAKFKAAVGAVGANIVVFTSIDGTETELDLSRLATSVLTSAQSKSDTDTTEGLVTGALLDGVVENHRTDAAYHAAPPTATEIGYVLTATAADTMDWTELPDPPATLTSTQAEDNNSTTAGLITGELLNDAITHHIVTNHEADPRYHAAPPAAADIGKVLTATAADEVKYQHIFDPTIFPAAGSEGSIGLNNADNTLDKVLGKISDYEADSTAFNAVDFKAAVGATGENTLVFSPIEGTDVELDASRFYTRKAADGDIATGTGTETSSYTPKQAHDEIIKLIEQKTRGLYLGKANKFNALPLSNSGRAAALADDFTFLEEDDLGTNGTAAKPDYPRGFYSYSGSAYTLMIPFPKPRAGVVVGTGKKYTDLPTTDQTGQRVRIGDVVWQDEDTKGTGTDASPEHPRGGYTWDGGKYVNLFDSISFSDTALPLPNGTASAGVSRGAARRDHTHRRRQIETAADQAARDVFKARTNNIVGDCVYQTDIGHLYEWNGSDYVLLDRSPNALYGMFGDRWFRNGRVYFAATGLGIVAATSLTFHKIEASDKLKTVSVNAGALTFDTINISTGAVIAASQTNLVGSYINGGAVTALPANNNVYQTLWFDPTNSKWRLVVGSRIGTSPSAITHALPNHLNDVAALTSMAGWVYVAAFLVRCSTTAGTLSSPQLGNVNTAVEMATEFGGRAAGGTGSSTTLVDRALTSTRGGTAITVNAVNNFAIEENRWTPIAFGIPAGRRLTGVTPVPAGDVIRITDTMALVRIAQDTELRVTDEDIPVNTIADGFIAFVPDSNLGTQLAAAHPLGGTMGEYVADQRGVIEVTIGNNVVTAASIKTELGVNALTRVIRVRAGTTNTQLADADFIPAGIYRIYLAGINLMLVLIEGSDGIANAPTVYVGTTIANPALTTRSSIAIHGTLNRTTHWWNTATQAWVAFDQPSQITYHTGTPGNPDIVGETAIALNTSTNTITHRWDIGTGAWVAMAASATTGTQINRTAAIASAIAGTEVTIGTLQIRYNTNGNGGNLEVRGATSSGSLTYIGTRNTTAAPANSGTSTLFNGPAGTYTGLGAGGLAINSYIRYVIILLDTFYEVIIANRADQFIHISATQYAQSPVVAALPAPAPTPVTATLTAGTFGSTGTNTRQFQETGGSGIIVLPAGRVLSGLTATAGVTVQFTASGGFSAIVPANVTAFNLTPTFIPDVAAAVTVPLTVTSPEVSAFPTNNINGAATYNFRVGDTVEVTLGPPHPLGRITSVTVPGGTVEILNARSGRVRITGVTAAGVITVRAAWASFLISGATVTPNRVEAFQPSTVQIEVPANNNLTGLTTTNGTVSGISANGLVTVTPDGNGDLVFTPTFTPIPAKATANHVANAGTALNCGSIRLRMNTAANRGLQIQSNTGANLTWRSMSNWEGGGSPMNTGTATTSGWVGISDFNFSAVSQFQNSIIWDETNNRKYLVYYTVQASFNNSPMMITEL